jgi:hypothetical protein
VQEFFYGSHPSTLHLRSVLSPEKRMRPGQVSRIT